MSLSCYLQRENWTQRSFMHPFSGSINKYLLRACSVPSLETCICGQGITLCVFYVYGAVYTFVSATTN